MKKLLNISVIAALAILPLAANAADLTEAQLAHGAVVTADATKVATTGYVKGAYSELATAINTKQDKLSDAQISAISNVAGKQDALTETQLNAVNSGIDSTKVGQYDALVTASGNYATQAGVVATVEAATASKTGVSLTVSGTPTGTISSSLSNGQMTGTVNMPTSGTVDTLTTWGDDTSTSTASVTLATTLTNISGTVTGDVSSTFTGTGITSGTATGNITGIDVTVASYSSGS